VLSFAVFVSAHLLLCQSLFALPPGAERTRRWLWAIFAFIAVLPAPYRGLTTGKKKLTIFWILSIITYVVLLFFQLNS
jgi:hypothetical protein